MRLVCVIFILVILGYNFPALKESDAMFSAERAPEWKDGEVCHRCRVAFGMVQRKVCNVQFISVIWLWKLM
jgi:hypothetical protein